MRNRKRTPLAERFFKYVEKTDTCWLWTGKSIAKFGYGLINMGGHSGKIERSHRVSWIIHNGEIPSGLCVCHHCDNPLCVNPDHLFLGTREDNNHDMQQKGRYDRVKRPKGERHAGAKLNDAEVLGIRAEYEQDKPFLRELAERYHVSIQTIYRIVHNLAWKHI